MTLHLRNSDRGRMGEGHFARNLRRKKMDITHKKRLLGCALDTLSVRMTIVIVLIHGAVSEIASRASSLINVF